ncbi:MAG: hypothetical protein QMD77_00940 [Patescibacteria group bacterium]|nr:hypothetical protein [Patescibacteria group bacterium]
MGPEKYETYQKYLALREKIDKSLRDVTMEEWDIIKKILFESKNKPLDLTKDIQRSLKVSGKGMEKVPEAKVLEDRLRIKFNILTDALGNFTKEDLECLDRHIVETLHQTARNIEYFDAHIELPEDIQKKVLERGLAMLISKLSDTNDVDKLSHNVTVLDTKIIEALLDSEIKKLMPEPTEEETRREVEGYFSSRERFGPMR